MKLGRTTFFVIVTRSPSHYESMTFTRLVLCSAFACFALSTIAGPAHAQSQVRLSYQAPEGCPSEEEFVSAVAARGGHFDATAGARVRGMEASIQKTAQGFEASLRIEPAEGASALRELHAANCVEIVNGLAVITAIALGGQPDEAPPDTAAPTPAPATSKSISPVAPAPPAVSPKLRLQGSTYTSPETVVVGPGTLRFERAASYTLGAGVSSGIVPSQVTPRYDLTARFANFVVPPSGSSYMVGPIGEVRFSWLGPTTYRHSADDFSALALGGLIGAGLCGAITYDSEGLVVLNCVSFGAGWMHVQTKSAEGSVVQSKVAFFGTSELALDAQYNLGSSFTLGLRLAGDFRFGDLSAERPDGSVLFKSADLGFAAIGGVGLHF